MDVEKTYSQHIVRIHLIMWVLSATRINPTEGTLAPDPTMTARLCRFGSIVFNGWHYYASSDL